jgi:hypothetical protein
LLVKGSNHEGLNLVKLEEELIKQRIVKVGHYRLKQDSRKHPVELEEDPVPCRTGENS